MHNRSFFFEHSAEMLCIFNESGEFLDLNQQWSDTLGYDLDVLKKIKLLNLIHPKDKKQTLIKAEELLSGEKILTNFENRCLNVNNDYVWLSWNIRKVDDYYYASARNITHLKEQQEHYQSLQESAQIGYWEIDLKTNTPIWSEKTYDIHGIPRGEKVDMSKALDFYIGDGRKLIEKRVNDGLEHGTPWDEEVEFLSAKNERIWVRAIGMTTVEDGVVVSLHGTFQDITDRKDAELQNKYLIENVGDGFFDWRIKDDFEYMSPRFWELLGYDPDEKKHHPSEWQKLIFMEDLVTNQKNFNLHISSRGRYPFLQEARFKKKDGSTAWVVRQGKVVEWDEKGKPLRMVGSHTDITQLKETQERLAESAKLASLGTLAGGIAHEINNPLTIISANATLLKILTAKIANEKIEKSIDTISSTVTRISKIIDGMKQLVRNQSTQDQKVRELSEILDEPISLCLENMKSKCIRPIIDIRETAKVRVNEIQVSQIILNLIGNAIDAVYGSEDPWVKVKTLKKGRMIKIQITDSGDGISEEDANKIFEPLYTTKDVGKGTGLGLSISKEIMEKHNGRLYLDSTKENTSFCFEFPII